MGGGDSYIAVMNYTECVPKIRMLKPNAQGDGVRRRGLWEVLRSEGGALMPRPPGP